jgi:hypothetical protein
VGKTNLLKETKNMLGFVKKTTSDIHWVGTDDGEYVSTWDEFEAQADFNYNSGYGGVEINTNLVIVGEDWWLERWEYDGSEGWRFCTKPQRRDLIHQLPPLRE